MQTEFGGARSRDQNLPTKNRQKVDELKTSKNSVITETDEKWFRFFEHAPNNLSFGYIRLSQLD